MNTDRVYQLLSEGDSAMSDERAKLAFIKAIALALALIADEAQQIRKKLDR